MNWSAWKPLLLTPRLLRRRPVRSHRVFLVGFGWLLFLGLCYAMYWMVAITATVSWDYMILVAFAAAWLAVASYRGVRKVVRRHQREAVVTP